MAIQIVVGSQWGDEGKGKIVDILSENTNLVVRSQGGNNAGHTVKLNNNTYTLKLIPSGILYNKVNCLISNGVVINPQALIQEIETLKKQQVSCENLKIDSNAHIIMPWHIALDNALEAQNNHTKIGTTKNGIGPCYADKAYRLGIRFGDLINKNKLEQQIKLIGSLKNNILKNVFNFKEINLQQTIFNYTHYGNILKPYITNSSQIIQYALNNDQNILFEGAQGTMLDINFGTYPFVTSSNTVAGGICCGSPIGPTKIESTIGVAKAYLTRVGSGPMPTELNNETGETIRIKGNEFGTNTKRPRRVGWLDCVMLKYSVQVNGLTELIINKLDTLQGISPIKLCVAYRQTDGDVVNQFPNSIDELINLTPIYEELPGFDQPISNITEFNNLPLNCQKYIKKIEQLCCCRISMVGVGPNRNQQIKL